MGDSLKEWKLIQGILGLLSGCGLLLYIGIAQPRLRDWLPLLPTAPAPDTIIFHISTMRRHFVAGRYAEAVQEADTILARDKTCLEASRVRAASLLRTGRFAEAESSLRARIAQDKYDLGARIDLAIALRGQNKRFDAEAVLLRVLEHPLITPQQKRTARALLLALSQSEDFSSLAELLPPSPEPSAPLLASPTPSTPPLTIRPPSDTALDLWLKPTPPPLVRPAPTPEPEVPALLLPGPSPEPLGTPEPGELESEVPPVLAPTPKPPKKPTATTKTPIKRKKAPSRKKKTSRRTGPL